MLNKRKKVEWFIHLIRFKTQLNYIDLIQLKENMDQPIIEEDNNDHNQRLQQLMDE